MHIIEQDRLHIFIYIYINALLKRMTDIQIFLLLSYIVNFDYSKTHIER